MWFISRSLTQCYFTTSHVKKITSSCRFILQGCYVQGKEICNDSWYCVIKIISIKVRYSLYNFFLIKSDINYFCIINSKRKWTFYAHTTFSWTLVTIYWTFFIIHQTFDNLYNSYQDTSFNTCAHLCFCMIFFFLKCVSALVVCSMNIYQIVKRKKHLHSYFSISLLVFNIAFTFLIRKVIMLIIENLANKLQKWKFIFLILLRVITLTY